MYKPGDEVIYYGSHREWYSRSDRVIKVKASKVLVKLEEVFGRCCVDEADLQPKVIQGCLFGYGGLAD